MAEAELRTERVVTSVNTVVLTLTEEEAKHLRGILSDMVVSSDQASSIRAALQRAGISYQRSVHYAHNGRVLRPVE